VAPRDFSIKRADQVSALDEQTASAALFMNMPRSREVAEYPALTGCGLTGS